MKKTSSPHPLGVWLALGSVYLVWGSTYLAIRFAVQGIPPYLMGGSRFLAAGILLYVGARAAGAAAPTFAHWRSAAIIGFLLITVGNGTVSWAEQKVPSGTACLLVATVPLWMVLLDWAWKKASRPGWATWAGLALGFSGTALLTVSLAPGGAAAPGGEARALALTGSAFLWALGSIWARSAPLPSSPFLSTAMEMACGGVLQLAVSGLTGEWGRFSASSVTPEAFASWAYLTLVGSLVGFTSYIWVLQKSNPALASTYAFVNPVIAVLLGWAFAGESLTIPVFAAAALIVSAVALILKG